MGTITFLKDTFFQREINACEHDQSAWLRLDITFLKDNFFQREINACEHDQSAWLRLDIHIVPDQILVRTNILGPGAVYISTQNFGLLLQ